MTIQTPILSPKILTCRRILANCGDWGEVGRQMVLRGDFDDEPEFQRLMAAYEQGQKTTVGAV